MSATFSGRLCIITLVALLAATPQAPADQLGTAITYQGELKQNGQPYAGPPVDLSFTLWDAPGAGNPPVGGMPIGNVVDKPGTSITSGVFTVWLNESNEFGSNAFLGDARWLQISVNDVPLAPRQPVTAAPYALTAQSVVCPLLLSCGEPGSGVVHCINTSDAPDATGLLGENISTLGRTYGVMGVARSSGFEASGVHGVATARTGQTIGVLGTSEASSLGTGVVGKGRATGGYFTAIEGHGLIAFSSAAGIFGESSHDDGIVGRTNTPGKSSFFGYTETVGANGGYFNSAATVGDASGLVAQCNSDSGRGIFGWATAPSGTARAVSGHVQSPDGYSAYFTGGRNYFEGALGIGVASPSPESTLHVRAGGDNFGVLVDSLGAAWSSIGLHAGPAGYSSLAKNAYFQAGWQRFDPAGGAFLQEIAADGTTAFSVAGAGANPLNWTRSITLTPTGDVGIGVVSPLAKVQVGETLYVDDVNGFVGVNRATRINSLERFGIRAEVVGSGHGAMYIETSSDTGRPTFGYANNGSVQAYHYVDGPSGDWRLFNGGNAGGIRMVIQGDGDVGLSRSPTANRLEVEGNASKTVAGSWLANSDARIKTDVQNIDNALETLDRVRLVSFRYTDAYQAEHSSIEDRRYLNVIAQEFAEVFPEAVRGSGESLPGGDCSDDGDEILQVDTYPLTIYSAAAVQELHTRVNALAVENLELREQLVSLRAEISALAATVQRCGPLQELMGAD